MGMGLSIGVWATNQWPHLQIKVTLPFPSIPNSSQDRGGASGNIPPSVLELRWACSYAALCW